MANDSQRHSVLGLVRRHQVTIAVALVVSLASSATVAAGAYLTLGASNSAAATTTLRSGVNGAVFQLGNTNSTGGTSARGLGITVPSGRAPITVNAAAGKATNLDADKLDGLDQAAFLRADGKAADADTLDGVNSTQFARGRHVTVIAERVLQTAVNGSRQIGGLGSVGLHCPNGLNGAFVDFHNDTSFTDRVVLDDGPEYEVFTIAPGGTSQPLAVWDGNSGTGGGGSFSVGRGTKLANRSARVDVRPYRQNSTSGCEFHLTAVVWTAAK